MDNHSHGNQGTSLAIGFAVRWQLTAMYDGRPFEQSLMAIYRFEEVRIAEDWGFAIRELWP